MAIRVQSTQKGKSRYVAVVQDFQRDGEWRIRTLQSFGPETPESLARAYQFKANCEAVETFASGAHTIGTSEAEVASAALVVFGLILGAAIVLALLSQQE